MKRIFLFLPLLAFAGNLFAAEVAADPAADFSAANKAYAEGKFSEAAADYQKILQVGGTSAALLFNYGNAEFKSGHLGGAIAAYRQAAQLAPRDAEIRANLAFVRNQVQGATVRDGFWQGWSGSLSLNEWTIFAATAFWLTLILLTARQVRPTLVARLKTPARVFAGLTIFAGAILGVQAAVHFSRPAAVVISAAATARSGPFDDAQNAFVIHDGAELSVLDRRDGWVQIADGLGKTGWLPVKQVVIVPGA
jgi:tetratricopeptide (TPR) repeat protein